MENNWYFIVICGLLSIIPASIVAIVFLFRYTTIKQDIDKVFKEADTAILECTENKHDYHSLLNRITLAEAEAHKVGIKLISVEESLTALSNKWSSRERTEKRSRRKEEQEVEEEETTATEHPALPAGFQLQNIEQAFANHPQPAQQQTGNVRKFGQMPGR